MGILDAPVTLARLGGAPLIGTKIPALEGVPALIIGDSYGQGGGSTDSDLGTTYFDRFFARHRTQTPVNRSIGGTRGDQILMSQVVPNWTANSRGVVGISDVVLNSVTQGVSSAETAATFRAILVYLTALYIAGPTDTGLRFGAGWTSGTSSTVNSYVDISFNGDTVNLLTTAVTGSGGTLTVANTSGTTVATITTGSNAQTFTQATKLSGFGTGAHSVRVTLTVGSATVIGAAIPSPTPPLILWVKPGARNLGFDTQIAAALTACQAILTDFPNVIPVAMDASYNMGTMLGPSAHPNDYGNAYIANLLEKALGSLAFGQGLNRLTVANGLAATAYTPTAPAYTSPGATVPGVPTSFTASNSTTQAILNWAAPTSDGGATITGYTIQYRLTGAGSWTAGPSVSGTTLTYTFTTGLTNGSGYDFQVAAVNSVGTGSWTATATATAAAPITTYAADTFTRSNTSGGPGTTETGGYTWTYPSGDTVEVVSNQLKGLVVSTAPAVGVVNDSQADGTISVVMPNAGSQGGVAFRFVADFSTGYIFYNNGTAWTLRKRASGTFTLLSTGTTTGVNAGDVVTVVLNGTSIVCKVNGTAVITTTDASFTGTRHGAYFAAANSIVDNFTHTSATS